MIINFSEGLSPRLERLKMNVMKRKGSFPKAVNPLIRAVSLWLASKSNRSVMQIRVLYLYELVRLATMEIEGELTRQWTEKILVKAD